MNKSIHIAILILFCSLNFQLKAQQKYEQESRLKTHEVPTKALELIQSQELKTKIKWYLEQGLDRSSVEAKFKFNDKRYSVEFDSIGHFEDVEVITTWDEMPEKATHRIAHTLDEECEKYDIQKIQTQYSGDPNVLKAVLKNQADLNQTIVRYELVVKCRTSEGTQLFEYLFDDSGKLLNQLQIVLKASSNLEY